MQISAEIRWFFEGAPPEPIDRWFKEGAVTAGGGGLREDVYLLDPEQHELGLKKRGKKPGMEIKGLIAVLSPIERGPFAGPIELWSKWTAKKLALDAMPSVAVSKTRWLRKYDAGGLSIREIALDDKEHPIEPDQPLPAVGCNLELTMIDLPGAPRAWSSLGFEAFGPLGSVESTLRRTVYALARHAPDVGSASLRLSYPAWLCKVFAPPPA